MIAEDPTTRWIRNNCARSCGPARRAAFKQAVIDKLDARERDPQETEVRLPVRGLQRRKQKSLLDSDLAVAAEIAGTQASAKAPGDKQPPSGEAARTPATPRHPHEPENTTRGCGTPMQRIGEDVARSWTTSPACSRWERHPRQVGAQVRDHHAGPGRPHVIDKGLPTTSLLAQVLVAKYLDHLPLYRQEGIFERAGHLIARSTLAQWVGECGVQLQPLVDALAAELLTPARAACR